LLTAYNQVSSQRVKYCRPIAVARWHYAPSGTRSSPGAAPTGTLVCAKDSLALSKTRRVAENY
jgi:hypothetical protein